MITKREFKLFLLVAIVVLGVFWVAMLAAQTPTEATASWHKCIDKAGVWYEPFDIDKKRCRALGYKWAAEQPPAIVTGTEPLAQILDAPVVPAEPSNPQWIGSLQLTDPHPEADFMWSMGGAAADFTAAAGQHDYHITAGSDWHCDITNVYPMPQYNLSYLSMPQSVTVVCLRNNK